jgi:uncharacterized phage protein gp47/JayE
MPWPRPTLTTLRTQARSDLMSLVGALLRFSNLGIMGDVLSGQTNGLYGYLDNIALQALPFTATALETIAGWAALKNVFQKQPQAAALQAIFAGTPTSVLPAGTSVLRVLDSFQFTTAADATVNSGGQVTAIIVATGPGAAGNTSAGAALVLGGSVAGISSQGGVAGSSTVVGVDLEDPISFRTRMLQAYSQPPQGGSVTDYVEWIEAVSGVTRAWVTPQGMGPGTVTGYFMMDSAEAGYNGVPQGSNGVATADGRDVVATGDQLSVANYVFTKCNVNALFYACAPASNTITISISGLSSASSAVKNAIQAAVAGVFLTNGSPGGVRLADGTAGGTILISDIDGAIGSVSGSAGYVIAAMTASAGSASPVANITSNSGALPVLAPIVWL